MGDVDLTHAWAQWIDRRTVAWQAGPTDGYLHTLVCARNGGLRSSPEGLAAPTGAGGPDRWETRQSTLERDRWESTGWDRWEIRLRARPSGLTAEQRQRYPHLSRYQAFAVDPIGDDEIAAALRCQVVAVRRDERGAVLRATGIQLAGVIDDRYAAATSAQLGATFRDGRPIVAVWAPTAQAVALELDSAAACPTTHPMTRDDITGVWWIVGAASWKDRYYRFVVTAFQPATGAVETVKTTDPYSLSLAVDSRSSQLVDLSDPALAPPGWPACRGSSTRHLGVFVHELSVRDFSIADPTVPAEHRGGYLAFTCPESDGTARLRELAAAGVTHLQLMPVFDFAAVPDRREDQVEPAVDLAALPPDSDQQQALVTQVADRDGYDWGYDPLHFTTPQGSYASDPDGSARILEFRRMVAALRDLGLGVIMDVAYNHTSASGSDRGSVLDQIVPGYYHRLLEDGTVATSTGGANTAPEHAMMGKLIVDSVVTWVTHYLIDGFRFDWMGYHPKSNLLAVRETLDRLVVEGEPAILLWGEGWNAGEVANDSRFIQATQGNLAGTGIGTFNDRLRDAVRGGGPADLNPRAQGFASGLFTDPNGDPINGSPADQLARLLHYQDLIEVGLTGNLAEYDLTNAEGRTVTGACVLYHGSPGGYTGLPAEAVTYVDSHDNEILYDALAYKLPVTTSLADRVRAQLLALSFPIFSQGIGFVVAGSDQLRSKSLDANSYRSGDWFNAILAPQAGNGFGRGLPPARDNRERWHYARPLLADPALVPGPEVIVDAGRRYTELLRIRATSPLFHLRDAADVRRRVSFPLSGPGATPGTITMLLRDTVGPQLDRRYRTMVVVFNAGPGPVTQTLAELAGVDLTLHPVLATSVDPVVRTAAADRVTGTLSVPGRTVAVFVEPRQ